MGKVISKVASFSPANLIPGVGDFLKDPLGSGAMDDARNAQIGATDRANSSLERMYGQQRADLMPWNKSGLKALAGMEDADFSRDFKMSDFNADPGYEFRMAEGMKALDRSAAARGGVNSGASLKAISRYGQDMASQEYQNAYNRFNSDRNTRFSRLSQIAGLGAGAANQISNAAGSYGNNLSANQTGLGNAIGGNYMAKGAQNAAFTGSLIRGAGSAMGA